MNTAVDYVRITATHSIYIHCLLLLLLQILLPGIIYEVNTDRQQ